MAPRKKPNKTRPQPAAPGDEPKNLLAASTSDLASYSEIQQNEYLATEAIYPDGFMRLHGRKDAWKNQENLAFQVRLVCLENPEIFVKLNFEFSADYPKVPLKVSIIDVQPENQKLQAELLDIVTTIPRSNLGSECVHEVTGPIDELLNSTAVSRAAKANPFSLEEERANRDAAARRAAEQKEELIRSQQREEAAKSEQALALKVESERKRREQATTSTSEEMAPDFKPLDAPHHATFDQTITVADTQNGSNIEFKSVDGRMVTVRQADKMMVMVTPVSTNRTQNPPQLLLKKIFLPQKLAPRDTLQQTMSQIEDLLEKSRTQRHANIIDLLGYKINHPTEEDGDWELDILSEWANDGSLEDLLFLSKTLPPDRVKDWTVQLLDALAFFDQQGFVHPAVHAGNVLICRSRNTLTVKLSDGYGTALRDLVDKAKQHKPADSAAQPFWIAPELNQKLQSRSAQTCIWDLGKIILQMAVGREVTEVYTSPVDCMKRKRFAPHFEYLLKALFRNAPSKRPNAFKLKAYAFFFDIFPALFSQDPSTFTTKGASDAHGSSSMRWETDWESKESLGEGGQGKVIKARNKHDQGIYAVKMIQAKTAGILTDVRQEVLMLKDLKHPSIVRYYAAWTEEASGQDTTSTSEVEVSQYQAIDFRDDRRAPSTKNRLIDLLEGPGADTFAFSQLRSSEVKSGEKLFGGKSGGMFAKPGADEKDDDSDDYENAFEKGADPEGDVEEYLSDDGGSSKSRPGTDHGRDNDPFEKVKGKTSTSGSPPARAPEPEKESTVYIQMEFCDQKTLKQLIDHHDICSNTEEMWRLFRSILEGLNYIHQRGMTHRDLKPANIFLDSDNNPKIGDFGLATAAFATHGSGGVGTMYYIAPELNRLIKQHDPKAGELGSKVDMYSLGIVLFEMNFPFDTAYERYVMLGRLNQAQHSLPPRFANPEYETQGKIVSELIDHDPKARPEASDLLARPEIPEPVEDEKMERRLNWIAENEPEKMRAWLLRQPNNEQQDILDLSWDYKGNEEFDLAVQDFVASEIRALFHRHGAVSTSRAGVFPRASQNNNAATFLGQDGLVVQLPFDLTIPFARSIASNSPAYSKYYAVGSIFRPRPNRADGDEPLRATEISFDFVSERTSDLPLKDAMTISVVDGVIRTFPILAATQWRILLSHNDLIDRILDFCRIRKNDVGKVKRILGNNLYIKGMGNQAIRAQWENIRATLRSESYNVPETSVASLAKFVGVFGPLDQVRDQLTKLLGKASHVADASTTLSRLQEILKHLERLQVQTKVLIAPFAAISDALYPGSVMFQCIDRRSGTILAVGGRYDNLVRTYQRGRPDATPVRAVGFRLSLSTITDHLLAAAEPSSKLSRVPSRDKPAISAAAIGIASRVDVLVTSFDPASLTTAGLDCLSVLVAGGVSAELTEEMGSMEEIEEKYARDAPYWLVIAKGAGLGGDGKVKVRGPTREEAEVKVGELVVWLGREMGRKGKAKK